VRRLLGNLALSLASAAIFLAVLEEAARLVEKRRPPREEVAGYIWDWDDKMPGGFYVMKSDAAGWPPWEEFNRDGLRDRTRTREKPEGWRRIAILGDSVTLGAEIQAEEAFPRRLAARFRAEGRRVEVMNVALWGWSTRQQRIAWQRIARGYRPDQAVLAVCLNDIPELFNNLSRPPRWLVALHERSALVRRLVDAEGREIDSVERLFAEPDSPRVREALEAFFEEVRALRREVEADGAEFALRLLHGFEAEDWASAGMPGARGVRIALHAGPVFCGFDPIIGRDNYFGSSVTRAARIEPVTPPGTVYASEAFAALLAASGQDACATDYVGRLPLAKGYGEARLYHLRRA
jgi:class 3 adenylate cyclase